MKYPPALFALATCYLDGRGVDQDIDQAKQLLNEASLMGMPEAAALLRDIEQNEAQAKQK